MLRGFSKTGHAVTAFDETDADNDFHTGEATLLLRNVSGIPPIRGAVYTLRSTKTFLPVPCAEPRGSCTGRRFGYIGFACIGGSQTLYCAILAILPQYETQFTLEL